MARYFRPQMEQAQPLNAMSRIKRLTSQQQPQQAFAQNNGQMTAFKNDNDFSTPVQPGNNNITAQPLPVGPELASGQPATGQPPQPGQPTTPGLPPGLNIPDSADSSTTSGFDINNPFYQALLPKLLASLEGMPGRVGNMSEMLQQKQRKNLGRSLDQGLSPVLESLQQRGILGSELGGQIMQGTTSDLTKKFLDQSLETNMAQEQSMQNLPGIYQSLMNNLGGKNITQSDQFAPITLLADLIGRT